MWLFQDFLEDLWSRIQTLSTDGWKVDSGDFLQLWALVWLFPLVLLCFNVILSYKEKKGNYSIHRSASSIRDDGLVY